MQEVQSKQLSLLDMRDSAVLGALALGSSVEVLVSVVRGLRAA